MTLKQQLQSSLLLRGMLNILFGWLGVTGYLLLILDNPHSTPSAFIFEDGAWPMLSICFAVSFLSTWLAHMVSDHKPGSLRLPYELPRLTLGPLLACSAFAFTLAFGLDFITLNSEPDILALALRTGAAMLAPWLGGVVVFLLCLLTYLTLR
jgi:hypothetical protein